MHESQIEQEELADEMLKDGHVPECINRVATWGGDCYCEYFGFKKPEGVKRHADEL